MNKQELIEKINELDELQLNQHYLTWLIGQLDVPETGHADEAPRYVKNILARLRGLPQHDREVWLKAIMGEFEKDFSSAKWREGYEQGKFEGVVERDKVTIPQFVAEYIEKSRLKGWDLLASMCFVLNEKNKKTTKWLYLGENKNIFALAWIYGYEVEEEKRYLVKMKGILKANEVLNYKINEEKWVISSGVESTFYRTRHTRKQLEEAGFGWVFDCEGIEIEEVTE